MEENLLDLIKKVILVNKGLFKNMLEKVKFIRVVKTDKITTHCMNELDKIPENIVGVEGFDVIDYNFDKMKTYTFTITKKFYKLNNVFNKIYVLVNNQENKFNIIKEKLDKYNILFQTIDTNSKIKCLESNDTIYHIQALNDAKKNCYKRILILNDTILLKKNFVNEFNKNYTHVPNDWQLLFLGCFQRLRTWNKLVFGNTYYRAKECSGSFAYGVGCSLYDKLINQYSRKGTIDICLRQIQKNTISYVMYPNLIISDLSNENLGIGKELMRYGTHMNWKVLDYE